jgi:hypothetical protein
MASIRLCDPWDGAALGYDEWKLRSPYDDEPEEECFHEDYEADINGRASCCRCDHVWYLTDEEILAERAHQAAYDEMCRREERRERWRRLTAPFRWTWYRALMPLSPRAAIKSLHDDEIPF